MEIVKIEKAEKGVSLLIKYDDDSSPRQVFVGVFQNQLRAFDFPEDIRVMMRMNTEFSRKLTSLVSRFFDGKSPALPLKLKVETKALPVQQAA